MRLTCPCCCCGGFLLNAFCFWLTVEQWTYPLQPLIKEMTGLGLNTNNLLFLLKLALNRRYKIVDRWTGEETGVGIGARVARRGSTKTSKGWEYRSCETGRRMLWDTKQTSCSWGTKRRPFSIVSVRGPVHMVKPKSGSTFEPYVL